MVDRGSRGGFPQRFSCVLVFLVFYVFPICNCLYVFTIQCTAKKQGERLGAKGERLGAKGERLGAMVRDWA